MTDENNAPDALWAATKAEHARCLDLLSHPIPNLKLRSPLEVYDIMRHRLLANPPTMERP